MNRLQNVVYGNPVTYINRIGFKNQPCLILRQLASFDVVRVIGHPNLQFMVEAAGYFCFLFIPQNLQDSVVRDFPV